MQIRIVSDTHTQHTDTDDRHRDTDDREKRDRNINRKSPLDRGERKSEIEEREVKEESDAYH